MLNLVVALMIMLIGASGCGPNSPDGIRADQTAESRQPLCESPPPSCDVSVNVTNLLTLQEISDLPTARWFRPPVLDDEDNIVGLATTKYDVSLHYAESYEAGRDCGADARGNRLPNFHLATDYDVIGKVNGVDPPYPVRAIGDGIVVYAGYVCKSAWDDSGSCWKLTQNAGWGYMVRILHKRERPDGTNEHLLSVYAHLGGLKWPEPSNIMVSVGEIVTAGQVIAAIGDSEHDGGLAWQPHLHHEVRRVNPFSDSAAEKAVLNDAGPGYACDITELNQSGRINPAEIFAEYGFSPASGEMVGQHPPGTIVAMTDWNGTAFAQRMYLVSGPGVVRHVEDEAAYYANRLYHDSSDRWGLAVPVSGHEFGCYEEGEPIRAGSSSITAAKCGKGTYVGFYGFGPPYRRRVAPDESLAAHRVILKSWGLKPGEVKASGAECGWPEAEQLWLRDGTVVEQASDDDFYVVSEGGYAFRLKRETFAVMGYPFSAVIQVPGGSVPSMVRGMRHGRDEFTVDDAMSCPNGAKGGSVEQESAPPDVQPDPPQDPPPGPCAHHAHRCGADPRSYEVCLMNYEGPENRELGTEWGAFPCPEGQECVGGGDCATPTPSAEPDVPDGGGAGGAPGDADGPAPDPQSQDGGGAGDGGRDVDAGSRPGMTEGGGVTGGAGGAPEGDAPEPTAPADPPHTIRCARRDDGTTLVTVTGPLLDGLSLMEGPSGEPSALMLGADGVGWPGPVSVPWLGDGAVHSVALPAGVESFNLYLAGADGPDWDPAAGTGTNSWLRLYEADGSPWATAGDCVMGAGLVLVLPREDAP